MKSASCSVSRGFRIVWLLLAAPLALAALAACGGSDDDSDAAVPAVLDRIAGPDSDLAVDHLPGIRFPPPEPEMFTWFGPADGRPPRAAVSRRDLVAVLADDLTVGDANDLLTSLEASIVGAEPQTGLLLLRLPDAETPEPLLTQWSRLLDDPRLAAVMPEDAFMSPLALPPYDVDARPNGHPQIAAARPGGNWVWQVWTAGSDGLPQGGNWGLMQMRLPQAWNLSDYVSAHVDEPTRGLPRVAVFDGGFTPGHEDLSLEGALGMPEWRGGRYSPAGRDFPCESDRDCAPDGACELGRCAPIECVDDGDCPNPASGCDGSTGTCKSLDTPWDHGTAVAGCIAATWDNGRGVTGVLPLSRPVYVETLWTVETDTEDRSGQLFAPTPEVIPTGTTLEQIENYILRGSGPRVINVSHGASNMFCPGGTDCIDPETETVAWLPDHAERQIKTWREYMGLWADTFRAVLDKAIQKTGDQVILAAAAGNCGILKAGPWRWGGDGHTCVHDLEPWTIEYQSQDTSPLTRAAEDDRDSYYVSVGAIRDDGQLANFSERGALINAPGELVRTVEDDETQGPFHDLERNADWDADGELLYGTSYGTSFASPYVAGVVAYLWSLDPRLTVQEIQQILRETTGSLGSVDAFAAALAIDDHRDGSPIHAALADMDDGTADGNLRWKITEPGCETPTSESSESCEERAVPPTRGDKTVDIRDFRVLRDAILQAEGTLLNGGANNPQKDLNRDGCVPGEAGDPEPVFGGSATCADAPGENVYPRADLNGDGLCNRATAHMADGDKTDVDVLAGVWGSGERPITLGYTVAALPDLIGSGDIAIDLSAFSDARGNVVDRVTIDATGLPEPVELDGPSPVLTVGLAEGIVVRAHGWRGEDEILCLKDTVDLTTAGQDVLARPNTPCEPPHFWLETASSQLGLSGICAFSHSSYTDEGAEGGTTEELVGDPLSPDSPWGCANEELGQDLVGRSVSASTAFADIALSVSGRSLEDGAEFIVSFDGSASGNVTRDANGDYLNQQVSSADYSVYSAIRTDLPEGQWDDWQVVVTCDGTASGTFIDPDYTGLATFATGTGVVGNMGCLINSQGAGETDWSLDGAYTLPLRQTIGSGNALGSGGSASAGGPTEGSGSGTASLSGTITIQVHPAPRDD